jgi:hypothetical protein
MVNGAFAKAFRSEVQPVEIAGALQREMDDKVTGVGTDRRVGPNTFTVELSTRDHERLSPYAQPLGAELASMVREHAESQGYGLLGPVEVDLDLAPDLGTGMFRVVSTTTTGVTAQPQRRPLHEPPPARSAAADPHAGMFRPADPDVPGAAAAAAGAAAAAAPFPVPVPTAPPVPTPDAAYRRDPEPTPTPEVAAESTPAPAPDPLVDPIPVDPNVGAPLAAAGLDDASTQLIRRQSGPVNPRLVVHGTAYPLNKATVTIGRGADVDIRINDPGISRHHATFHVGEPCSVVDLASTNGTFVRDERITEAALTDGDEIRVGTTLLLFRVG